MDNTKTNFYFPKLDGLRFLAFLLVLFHHIGPWPHTGMTFFGLRSWLGVELFFVLSSFLLTKLMVEELKKNNTISIKKFYFRRILRIWPLYFLYLILVIILALPKDFTSLDIYRLIGTCTFTDNIFTAIWNYNFTIPSISHLWTISIEEQYYIFLPFALPALVKLSRTKQAIAVGALFLVFVALRMICVIKAVQHPVIWVMPFQGDAFLFGTLYGLGFFDSFLSKIKPLVKIAAGVILIGITFSFPNIDVVGYSQVVTYTFIAMGFVFIIDGVLKGETRAMEFIFGNRVVRYLGKITYGLYIYHLIGIKYGTMIFEKLHLTKYPDSPLSWRLRSLIVLLLVIAVSSISYELIEKPFLKLKKRFSEITTRPI